MSDREDYDEGGGYDDDGGYEDQEEQDYGDDQGYEETGGYEQDYNQGEYDQGEGYGQEKEQEDNQDDYQDSYRDEPQEGDYGAEQVTCGYENNATGDTPTTPCAGESTNVKGIFDGFEHGIEGLIGHVSGMAGTGGGLTNVFSSGGMESMVEKMIGEAAHRFIGVEAETGKIIGAIAGNLIFNMGGKGNSLTNIGKVILDNIISGKFRRDIHPFVPPVPGATSFGLNFHEERDKCLQQHRLFEDPEFPAGDRSLYYKSPPDQQVQWLRPGEIVSSPQLIVGHESRFAVKQGGLGDCWLLAAVANLTLREELFYRVVPPDQSFTENYAGIFHFQFWRYGQWVDVVIDDKLPCSDGQLIYMHSHDGSEFWSALLEKAYAKLYGSYENLEGGTTAEALEDFTGGLTEFFDLTKADKTTVLAMMIRGFQMGSLFGCSIEADPARKEAQLNNGLVCGHAYSITALHTVNVGGQDIPLVRIRNPWGNSKEWTGAWSDSSSEWYQVSESDKQKLGVNFSKDGEFWMSFDDFYENFQELEICNMSAGIQDELLEMTGTHQMITQEAAPQAQWEEQQQDGEWSTRNGTAGGCANNPSSYANNPQYGSIFTVTEQSVEQDGKCTVIVAVLQKYRRELRTQGKDSLPIGFAVYQMDNSMSALSPDFFRSRNPVAKTKVFINMREVTSRFRVPPGQYVIVPCTFDPNCDGEFLLRVYANGELKTERLR